MQPTNIATKRVVWREGTLLRPQHLQQQQLHLETQAQLRAALTTPYGWGLGSMDVDEDLLIRGDFCLRFVNAIFPDGLLVHVGSDHEESLQRSMLPHFERGQKDLRVYLAVPQNRSKQHVENETTPNAWANRYESSAFEVYDTTSPGQSAEIELAWPKISILFGDEAQDKSNLLPIAKVVRQGTGYGLDPTFIPPSLHIHASTGLQLALRALLSKALERLSELQNALSARNNQHLGFEPQDLQRYLWLGSISGAIATLQAMQRSRSTTPYTLFLELSRWAGQFSSLQKKGSAFEPQGYIHVKAERSFAPLFDQLFALLEECMISDYSVIELKRRSDGMWLTKLDTLVQDDKQQFILAVKSEQGYESTAKRLPALAKVASYKQISQVINQAVSGANIRYLPRPPACIPLHADWVYFSIHKDNRYWTDIMNSRCIAFYAGHPFIAEDTRIQIYSAAPIS